LSEYVKNITLLPLYKVMSLTLIALLIGCASSPKVNSPVSPPKPSGINQTTEARVQAWKQLIDTGSNWSDAKKLISVNDFINEVRFIDDIDHWGKHDYWATPLQTVVTNGGDCEDISIAKFFTLTAMGMEENKLRLSYVKSLLTNKPHMVVSYFKTPRSMPLALDNLNPSILPASQRDDLVPVYSFNGTGLWITKRGQVDTYLGGTQRISLWQQLLNQMNVEAANEYAMICLYQYYDLPEPSAKNFCPSS